MKQIPIIVVAVAVIAGIFGWLIGKNPTVKNPIVKTEFAACGNKEKYQEMPWWNKFKNNVEQTNFYSANYIESRLQEFHNNEYSNPSKKYYAYDAFCENYKNYDICVGKNEKLLVNNDIGNEMEGCLSKDGALFIAVFPGVYFGGGNYIFRYDINNNVLEEAKRINEKWGEAWIAVPREILKIDGNVMKMKGIEGDAGGGIENNFDYDFVDNQVRLTKSCTIDEGVMGQCTNY